jgi:hypothetical protein
LCGVNYCPAAGPSAEEILAAKAEGTTPAPDAAAEPDSNFEVSRSSIYILAGVYLACSLLSAIVVALFVDPLTRQDISRNWKAVI